MKKILLFLICFTNLHLVFGQVAGTLDSTFNPTLSGDTCIAWDPTNPTNPILSPGTDANGNVVVQRFNTSGVLIATYGPFTNSDPIGSNITDIYVRPENGNIYVAGVFTNYGPTAVAVSRGCTVKRNR